MKTIQELIRALYNIAQAIKGNDGGGLDNSSEQENKNDIILPKYAFVGYQTGGGGNQGFSESVDEDITIGNTAYEIFEIDYDGKIMNFIHGKVSEEDLANMKEYVQNHISNPVYSDNTKRLFGDCLYLYTKEQIDTINKDSIVQLCEGTITKFDNNIYVDILDISDALDISNVFIGLPVKEIPNYAQRGQYYFITVDNSTNVT